MWLSVCLEGQREMVVAVLHGLWRLPDFVSAPVSWTGMANLAGIAEKDIFTAGGDTQRRWLSTHAKGGGGITDLLDKPNNLVHTNNCGA